MQSVNIVPQLKANLKSSAVVMLFQQMKIHSAAAFPSLLLMNIFCRLFSSQHFVSERKYDEDLGKAVRFTFDLEPLKTSISGFGSGTFICFVLFLFVFRVNICENSPPPHLLNPEWYKTSSPPQNTKAKHFCCSVSAFYKVTSTVTAVCQQTVSTVLYTHSG